MPGAVEWSHLVVSQGPYRYVRHPAYLCMILFEPAMSTLLASWWAIVAGVFCAILLVVRSALEDRSLQTELPGYTDYARQVRYRLLPGVWYAGDNALDGQLGLQGAAFESWTNDYFLNVIEGSNWLRLTIAFLALPRT